MVYDTGCFQEPRVQAWLSWVLYSGSYQATAKVSVRAGVLSELKDLPQAHRLVAEFSS